MMRSPIETLLIASHNPGKVSEITALLAPFGLKIESARAFGISEPEETGSTFAQNAILKAEHCCAASGLAALADDSGIEVTALNGAPGIYSGRWAGPDKDFNMAMQRIENEVQAVSNGAQPDRRAGFVCCFALAIPGAATQVFEGRIAGHIVWPPRGHEGFGYDPLFVPQGQQQTYAELGHQNKLPFSPRTRAFEKLMNAKPWQ